MSSEVSAVSDVWSVGCTVIELLTGQPPYYESNPMAAMFKIVEDPHPPFPPEISPELEGFLKLCFEKNPKLRASSQELQKHPWLKKNKQLSIKGKVCRDDREGRERERREGGREKREGGDDSHRAKMFFVDHENVFDGTTCWHAY